MLNIFSDKVKAKITIKLVENNKMIDDEIEIPKLFNKYFLNIVRKKGLLAKISAHCTKNDIFH